MKHQANMVQSMVQMPSYIPTSSIQLQALFEPLGFLNDKTTAESHSRSCWQELKIVRYRFCCGNDEFGKFLG